MFLTDRVSKPLEQDWSLKRDQLKQSFSLRITNDWNKKNFVNLDAAPSGRRNAGNREGMCYLI